ncbi:MAG: pantoate--beta-alanine ligase [Fuerstiella sp.]
MNVESSASRVRELVRQARQAGAIVGVVPTMGALHAGHVSLIEAARRECDFVVTTIFVNPTQFGPNEDFDRYPRTLPEDLQLCEAAGTDLVFTPETTAMYHPDAETVVRVTRLTERLEGAHRPGHFDGVTTVVAKLFNITVPDRAYFGQKDFQQQLIIRRMVRDLNWGLEVVTCPIVRESDGLALSSRNRYLSDRDRQRALALSQSLQQARTLAADETVSPAEIERRMIEFLTSVEGLRLDYAVVVDGDTLASVAPDAATVVALVAAEVGTTRLIDNQILRFR